jgi:hypothetical protein
MESITNTITDLKQSIKSQLEEFKTSYEKVLFTLKLDRTNDAKKGGVKLQTQLHG